MENYNAKIITLNNKQVLYRRSRVTPKKVGEFVALWKKDPRGPYQSDDDFAAVVIEMENKQSFFLFPKAVLIERGIVGSGSGTGKQGFRVYPSELRGLNATASRTQKWQASHYIQEPFDAWIKVSKLDLG